MLAAIMMPALAQARMVAQKTVCASNLKGLGAAMMVYTKNNNNTYPSTDNWCGLLVTNCNVTPKQFCCPSNDVKTGQSSYAININIAGKKVSEVPPDTVLLFEAKAGVNPAGGPELLTTENHQPEGCNILFADAHVEFVKKENLSTLRWTTE
jgi:prepilin-type processing-associated H-X9-DG protein